MELIPHWRVFSIPCFFLEMGLLLAGWLAISLVGS